MLTPKQYRLLPQNIINLFEQLEDEVISQMAKSMKETLELSANTDYQLDVLQRMGYDLQQIKREIAKRTDLSVRKVNSLMLDSAYLSEGITRRSKILIMPGGEKYADIQIETS